MELCSLDFLYFSAHEPAIRGVWLTRREALAA
jgi:hypothetical protein